MKASVRVYVSAGSNIDPRANLEAACAALKERYPDLELSPVYESPAEGFSGPPFLNLVVSFRTNEAPEEILEALAEREALVGRDRSGGKFASRTLDLDLLLYGDRVDEALKLPHPDIERYAFVLKPLADLAPHLRHPVSGATIAELWRSFAHPRQFSKVQSLCIQNADRDDS
ncbi:MAG: 2-amino-4-hydroxy-6-hydroxymethyldihydropteridine diphosphokinase [Gammaproteobacteria bacterium]|nr:2-amino-4-hydroxy-6-hydroxymethyldihydropteridine diphosphokinase [Gammaproteobacteria bacterium]